MKITPDPIRPHDNGKNFGPEGPVKPTEPPKASDETLKPGAELMKFLKEVDLTKFK